jgi:hypothetical protein
MSQFMYPDRGYDERGHPSNVEALPSGNEIGVIAGHQIARERGGQYVPDNERQDNQVGRPGE